MAEDSLPALSAGRLLCKRGLPSPGCTASWAICCRQALRDTSTDLECLLPAALGVAGVLRRVRLWAEEDNIQGSLTLLPRRLRGWMRTRQRHR